MMEDKDFAELYEKLKSGDLDKSKELKNDGSTEERY